MFDRIQQNKDKVILSIPIDIGDRKIPIEFFMCRREDLEIKKWLNDTSMTEISDFCIKSKAKHYKVNEREFIQ